ncbi:glycerophosphodiester phosphodiesterase [Lipingzhangella sp. LS1_29]|uniref:Glycerophosphodiester phosphodiesterase n=1 Tax=Lipingzhangella rawalii TaxID=2055835 RepID=A0ABU2H283_9ACTN|nr:glycerophosphodiester phosphodiesterase [Lipingzhangella rawalii]MDS1268974.1 glycerophosphodiester phosphodiesterase [Lipingzhangella rawalii]
MTNHYLDIRPPIALAHRGGWLTDTEGPPGRDALLLENTLPAFRNAVELGYQYLETDIHASRDGVAMAFHDATLDRVTDRDGAIAELDYAEIRRARVGGRETVPSLEELLDAWPRVRLNIDIKDDRAVEPLARALRRTRSWRRVCVGSFSQARLERARRILDRPVCMSAGPVDVARIRVGAWSRALSLLVRRGVGCVQIPRHIRGFPLLTRDLIRTAHRHGMQVHVWTVNEASTMHRLLDAGVDGIVTDNTVALRRVLTERGQWPGTAVPSTHSTGRTNDGPP